MATVLETWAAERDQLRAQIAAAEQRVAALTAAIELVTVFQTLTPDLKTTIKAAVGGGGA